MAALRLLAVAAASGRIAYVYLIGNRLMDWRVSDKASDSEAEAAKSAARWIETLQPDVVVTEDTLGAKKKGRRTKEIIASIAEVASRAEVLDVSVVREQLYLACFVECVVCGTSDPEHLSREKIKRAMRRNGSLRERIERSHRQSETIEGGLIHVWQPEDEGVKRVILKLARCHAAYELNEPRLDEPQHVLVMPLVSLTDVQRNNFESTPDVNVWPEVGSRAMQRMLIADDAYAGGWMTVQDGRYRFLAVAESSLMVRGVISEYLAFEVIWE